MHDVLRFFQITVSFGLEGVPLGCIGASGYQARLTFWMIAPICMVVLVLILTAIAVGKRRLKRLFGRAVNKLGESAPSLLKGMLEGMVPEDDNGGTKSSEYSSFDPSMDKGLLRKIVITGTPFMLKLGFALYPSISLSLPYRTVIMCIL